MAKQKPLTVEALEMRLLERLNEYVRSQNYLMVAHTAERLQQLQMISYAYCPKAGE